MSRTLLALVVLALCTSAVLAALSDAAAVQGFKQFKAKYGKSYSSPIEANRRFAIWRNHMDFIEAHNAKHAAGLSTFTTAENEFCDLSSAEFVATMNGYKAPAAKSGARIFDEAAAAAATPASWDWRTKGAVTAIKNQGQCGSCWSFSTTGSTEGAHFLAGNSLVSLSEQNLVDCSTPEGNEGCNGGQMELAFEYIIKNKGIDTEASYPYTATGPNKCKFSTDNIGATLSHYTAIATGSESGLTSACGTTNPVSVAIDASHQSFQVYSSGVYYEPACSSTQLDHGVLVVGYIWMTRDGSNNCGIASDASYPIV
jgi:cathepsin L